MTHLSRIALAVGLACTAAPFAQAADLPAARTLIDAHVAAIGGRKAVTADIDGTALAKMEIVEAGIKGDMAIHSLGRNSVVSITLPGIGESRMGYVDGVAWSMDPMSGPRLLDGKERQQMAEQFDPLYTVRDASLVTSATTTGLGESEGRPCHRVEIKWASGDTTTDCYGTADKLLLSTESKVITPMGEVVQVSHFSEYATHGKVKVKVPTVTTVKVAGMTQRVRIESYQETKPDAALFALPPAIQALVKKAAAPASAAPATPAAPAPAPAPAAEADADTSI